jgi:hypothetical protein
VVTVTEERKGLIYVLRAAKGVNVPSVVADRILASRWFAGVKAESRESGYAAARSRVIPDYRPETEEIRDQYAKAFGWQVEARLEIFDRWLASVKAEAWDEGALWAAVECDVIRDESVPWLALGDNPYRQGVE